MGRQSGPTVRNVVRDAVRVYRAFPKLVAGLALVVFGGAAVLDVLVGAGLHAVSEEHPSRLAIVLLAAILTGPVSVTSAALVFYAGMMERIAGHYLYGRAKPDVRNALRTLPWKRLIIADAFLMLLVGVGSILGIVPGLALFTLFCLVGPIINIERISVRSAFRRSIQLVRRKPALAFLLITIPVTIEDELIHGFEFLDARFPLLTAFVLAGAIGVVLNAFLGLIEVTMAHALIRLDPAASKLRQE